MEETQAISAPQAAEERGQPKRRSRYNVRAPQVTFPTLMLTAAVIKDVVDAVDFTGFGVIISSITSVIYNAAVFVWMFGMGGGGMREKVMKRAAKRYAAMFIVSFIPWVKIIPEASLFVILTYLDRKEESSKHLGGMYRAARGKLMGK